MLKMQLPFQLRFSAFLFFNHSEGDYMLSTFLISENYSNAAVSFLQWNYDPMRGI